MSELIFKRRKRDQISTPGQTVVKINNEEYNKVLEVADETGLSIREVVSRMVEYAYEHVRYEADYDNDYSVGEPKGTQTTSST